MNTQQNAQEPEQHGGGVAAAGAAGDAAAAAAGDAGAAGAAGAAVTHATAPLLVAIDGPAGSGKSSVSREAATQLGFGILDTGAAYRTLAWAARTSHTDPDDETALLELLSTWQYRCTLQGEQRVNVGLRDGNTGNTVNHDVTAEIRDPDISARVSAVARHPRVRDTLNAMFRQIVADSGLPGVVIEGRDITTVVAPEAPVRILLTASAEVRAQRRAGELAGADAAAVLADLAARDAKDAQVVDFMTPAPGVTLIDTSHLNFDESVRAVSRVVQTSGERVFRTAPEQ